jgi:hypothetical protein
MSTALIAVGWFFVAAVFAALAVVGRRDSKKGVAPDVLPNELRESLGLWRDVNLGEGAARAEDAFLSPQFKNSRSVGVNVLLALAAAVAGVATVVAAIK